MTDKELLELAARAADIDFANQSDDEVQLNQYVNNKHLLKDGKYWNPLTDDGDALRLAVKLRMSLDLFDDFILAGYTPNDNECLQIEEPHKNEPMKATRRAIVRAAAEIGKTK